MTEILSAEGIVDKIYDSCCNGPFDLDEAVRLAKEFGQQQFNLGRTSLHSTLLNAASEIFWLCKQVNPDGLEPCKLPKGSSVRRVYEEIKAVFMQPKPQSPALSKALGDVANMGEVVKFKEDE